MTTPPPAKHDEEADLPSPQPGEVLEPILSGVVDVTHASSQSPLRLVSIWKKGQPASAVSSLPTDKFR